MKKTNGTKRALLMSALALVLCVSMLIGSTFAWFTDSVTSTGNKIVAGNLDVDLYLWTSADGEPIEITNESAPVFGEGAVAQNVNESTLWEPGKTQVAYLSIKNNGNLDLKYKVAIDVQNVDKDLYEVMEYAITPDAQYGEVETWTSGIAVQPGINATEANDVELKVGQEHFFALSIHMKEDAGNDYMDGQVNFDIKVLATQLASEFDSFGPEYDTDATYPARGTAVVPENTTEPTPIKAGDVSVAIPAGAPAGEYALNVENVSFTTDENGKSVANFDITLSKDGQAISTDTGVEYTVTIKVAVGINNDNIKVLHKGVEVTNAVADPVAGTVTFTTASFSPFTVEYTVDCDMYHDAETNTFYVFTADGLAEVNEKFMSTKVGHPAGAKIKLMANIDMDGKVWNMVESHTEFGNYYLTELDGQGFTILNLSINGQAMFKRFAGAGNLTIKDVSFDNAVVNSSGINASILTVQCYQNVLLDNVDVKNSFITGSYKVAPLIGSVYNESSSTVTATLKNCDVSNTVVTATGFDFCTTGMVAFVHAGDNDKIAFENCTVADVQLYAPNNGYTAHAAIYTTGSETLFNEAEGVTVTNVTFESK